MPAERGPSGTGHDTAGRRDSDLLAAPLSTRDGEPILPAPVAVPGPASEPICPGPHGNGCDCKHNGADPHCPWVPGHASVSPAEPFKRPSSYRPEFESHASPEAIQAHIVQARNHAESIQYELGWLEGLYLRRVAEKAAGRWP